MSRSSPLPADPTSNAADPQPATSMAVDDPTPVQRSGRQSPVDPQSYSSIDRPLNVTDALGYLDAVKGQFHDQPDVYNQFLDIMKDFKHELIDTPGVIKRVSQLFNGHSALIQGFNTFLPVGYRIECSTDAHDSSYITVTTPSGITMQTTNNGPGRGPIRWSVGPASSSNAALPEPSARPPSPEINGAYNGQAIEPAVQYVQKIKNRCDPETYRQFLDILSRYHHKPETIDEEEVSRQIALLFKDAPDLRADFRVFMPEQSRQLLDESPPRASPHRTGTPLTDARNKRKLDTVANAASLPTKRKRKVPEKEMVPPKPVQVVALKLQPSSERANQGYGNKNVAGPSSPQMAHNQLPPAASRPPLPVDETHFFERVKRALDNRDTYNEFLKVVNLFTQDYIDTARLVKESRHFLGDGDLCRQFKEILGWDELKEREYRMAEFQNNWTKPTPVQLPSRVSRIDPSVKYGSYRRLSSSEANVMCSGRDEMCRSVLNDEWVSHPTWSSEDSGFIAHKKNIYEEALHRSEEERHEYDFHIEAITRTIALLEPLHNKIAQLSAEDRTNFKLKPHIGGSWKAIHTRVIKKIYGRDLGLEVISSMQDAPVLAIPIVLKRLKQKEEEWKRSQREWNKVWREVDARNYTKSLDHQAIVFKTSDKKAITTKYLVSQIEGAREEQMAKRASLIDPLFARTRPRHQLEYVIDDTRILQDALKLTFSFLDRTQGQINFAERKRIEGFLRSFIPLFFVMDSVAFNSAFVVQETNESDGSDDVADDAEASSVASSGRGGRGRRGAGNNMSSGGDLRKKLLKSEQAKSTSRKTRAQEAAASPAVSRLASPVFENDDSAAQATVANKRKRSIFFTNTTFYALLRLVELLYSRLYSFRDLAARLVKETPDKRYPSKEAIQAGMASQAQDTITSFGEKVKNPEHLYELLLASCERLFDNEIEQHAFEDQIRFMFGTKEAYKIFTVDKVIGGIIKQVQAIIADSRSQELLEILKRERSLASFTSQDQINSRRSAEKILGPDENLFHIDWLSDSKMMTIQLIGKDDSSFDDAEVLTGRWQAYTDSYVSSENTAGVPHARVRSPFLRRNIPAKVRDVQPDVVTQDGQEIKVCVRTYRLFFVPEKEDYLWKFRSKAEMEEVAVNLKKRNALRRKWLEKSKLSPPPMPVTQREKEKTQEKASTAPGAVVDSDAAVGAGAPSMPVVAGEQKEDVEMSQSKSIPPVAEAV
ncbi:Paired amphipathic helix protein pst1 [Leucoagaricus sp. SymC.cos]|nr:Paired amphipathic helix protein pst1 [Leucoagaricus sp. SymC.cos]